MPSRIWTCVSFAAAALGLVAFSLAPAVSADDAPVSVVVVVGDQKHAELGEDAKALRAQVKAAMQEARAACRTAREAAGATEAQPTDAAKATCRAAREALHAELREMREAFWLEHHDALQKLHQDRQTERKDGQAERKAAHAEQKEDHAEHKATREAPAKQRAP